MPTYNQAGTYNDITVSVSDGKTRVEQHFNITVEQAYPLPVFAPIAAQTLREGEKFSLQLAATVLGGVTQADGSTVSLDYSSPWMPGGAFLNSETGWFEWTPGYNQHQVYRVPVMLTAKFTAPDGTTVSTHVTQEVVLTVLNANGMPEFEPVETWNIIEGQPLRISVFAFDPDNPSFEPKIRLSSDSQAIGEVSIPATVSYVVTGLPLGATFDAETLEIVWTPGYAQAGTYSVNVTATDTGDGTGVPAISHLTLPIVKQTHKTKLFFLFGFG